MQVQHTAAAISACGTRCFIYNGSAEKSFEIHASTELGSASTAKRPPVNVMTMFFFFLRMWLHSGSSSGQSLAGPNSMNTPHDLQH